MIRAVNLAAALAALRLGEFAACVMLFIAWDESRGWHVAGCLAFVVLCELVRMREVRLIARQEAGANARRRPA